MAKTYKIDDAEGLYFVTFSVVEMAHALSLPAAKDIIVESLIFCQHNKGLKLYAWVIMDNHIHLIMDGKKGPAIIRDLKKFTSTKILQLIKSQPNTKVQNSLIKKFGDVGKNNPHNRRNQLWIQNYHAVLLYSPRMMYQRLNYLHNNPVLAGLVDQDHKYLYSSAVNYYGGKGLINLLLLA